MSLKYEEAKNFATELAKSFGETVVVVGDVYADYNDAEAQEIVNPNGETIQGLLQAGVGNCAFAQFPFSCLNLSDLDWHIEFRGVKLFSLDPLRVIQSLTPEEHGWYPCLDDTSIFDKIKVKKCKCGTKPHVYAVNKDGHIQAQVCCPDCGRKSPLEPLDGDAVEAWNNGLQG